MSPAADTLRVVTYNVRRCGGPRGGERGPSRVAAVIRRLDPDVVGLQEIDFAPPPGNPRDTLHDLARATGLGRVEGPALRRGSGSYGNALLTRLPVLAARRLDLSVAGREPRAALDVVLDAGAVALRLLVVHLGLNAAERAAQARVLERIVDRARHEWLVMLGDFNEWRPLDPVGRRFDRRLGRVRPLRTFPARAPVLPLDRVWVRPRVSLLRVTVPSFPPTRTASDHRPLVADLDVAAAAAALAPGRAGVNPSWRGSG